MSEKCKQCPKRATCKDACYGEPPCEFALAFDALIRELDDKQVCMESLRKERDEARQQNPTSRTFGEYILSPMQSARSRFTSWWISKCGYTKALYCFTADDEKEVQCQIRRGVDAYIRLLEDELCR